MIPLLWLGGGSVSIVDAASLHDKWLTADLTMKVANQGSVRWLLKAHPFPDLFVTQEFS